MAMEEQRNEPPQEPLVELKYRIYRRLLAEDRWREVVAAKDTLIREARDAGHNKDDAQRRAYLAIEQMFPPLPSTVTEATAAQPWEELPRPDGDGNLTEGEPRGQTTSGVAASRMDGVTDGKSGSGARARGDADSQVVGLGDLPESWGRLPPNAPLAAEIQWVQANRLQCVTEVGEQAQVDLAKALTPAPSYAALGWLETSIRAYTKFVDVAAKATASLEDEREHTRRERMAIDDIRKLLAEMVDG
jgi:hypothetical protein